MVLNRWVQVYRIREGIDWLKRRRLCVDGAHWSPGFELDDGNEKFDVRLADPNGILGVSDTRPEEAEIDDYKFNNRNYTRRR